MSDMKLYRRLLIIVTGIGLFGLLSACQTGHPYSTRYHNGLPVGNKAKKIPVPAIVNKPEKPVKRMLSAINVRKGDTIYALSRRYHVTVRALIQTNHLKPPYMLYPGQRLKSPATAIHTVVKADTVYSLSRKYRVDMTTFARLNGLKRPYILTIGQKLKVPGGPSGKASSGAVRKALPPPPPRSGKGFMWPVKGPILSSFGPKNKGYHNDGINIAARSGSYVRASESGVVVHAGRKIKGFGRLILIRHSNGWLTAYAHNSSILVKKGQAVKRGQAIARVGKSGGVNRPQLHFELRKGARAVNPVKYLRS